MIATEEAGLDDQFIAFCWRSSAGDGDSEITRTALSSCR
jgi:hypothetical protein